MIRQDENLKVRLERVARENVALNHREAMTLLHDTAG
jgi:hypothetical protein